VPEYFCPLSVNGSSLCMATVNFNFMRGLWKVCAHVSITTTWYTAPHSHVKRAFI